MAISSGLLANTRSWKRQRKDSPQSLKECGPDFNKIMISDLQPQELWENKLLLFKATISVVIYYSNNMTLTLSLTPSKD